VKENPIMLSQSKHDRIFSPGGSGPCDAGAKAGASARRGHFFPQGLRPVKTLIDELKKIAGG
jgi:hypothetical protein